MSKYIDAEKLIRNLSANEIGVPFWGVMVIKAFKKVVKCQPEAVVRCKDCKYRDTIPEFSNWLLEGCRWANEESPDDDDFCSYGERKEE